MEHLRHIKEKQSNLYFWPNYVALVIFPVILKVKYLCQEKTNNVLNPALPALFAWLLFSSRILKMKVSTWNYKLCTSLYEEKYMFGTKFQWHNFYHLWLCKIFYNYEDLWDLPVEHFNVPVHEFFTMKSNTQRPQLRVIHPHSTPTSLIMLFFVAQ